MEQRLTGKHMASAGVHQPAWDWARGRGLDPALLLEGTGLAVADIEAPACVLTTAQQFQLLHNLMALADQPAIGLEVGSGARLEALGLLGLTLASAPSIREALNVGGSFAVLGGSLGDVEVSHDGDETVIGFSLPPLSHDMQRYLTEDFFAALLAYLAVLRNGPVQLPPESGRISPLSVAFAYPSPEDLRPYEAVFRCPLAFDAERSEMRLDDEQLDQAPFFANPLAFSQGLEACRSLSSRLAEESVLVRDARQVIARDPAGCATLPAVAGQLGVNARALQRRFAEAGLHFSELLADVRHALARDLLRNSELTVRDVAELLGYSEPGNFRRAFRQWTGSTPSAYRRSLK
jgi:AraC-like DNA-binding protein